MNAFTRPAPSTRDRILRSAVQLIKTRSYLGFSFQDVADEVGIRKPSLHHHFPTKESLGAEVMRTVTQAFEEWTETTPATPAGKFDAYLARYRSAVKAGHEVCPAGALAPGWDCIDSDLRRSVTEMRKAHIAWLANVLRGVRLPKTAGSADAAAAYAFAVCQGALISARMTGKVKDFDLVVAPLRRTLIG